ncbi:Uma2 family endonuclease [Chamaesiphon sp. OTE_20_metabat_361]|nr:Uma2 family endonuclease [Chamaesiphon sp. OTE_20_metabat_361]
MIAAKEHFPQLTPAEYLDWEEQQELRHEYLNGEVYAMTGGTMNHSQIAGNFITLLNIHLRSSGCRVLNADAKVQIAESNDYVYPDVSVTCDERDKTATKFISHPCLIVEVLSPSTAAYDRRDKFNFYRRSDSLQDYVLVDTQKIEIDIYSKNDRGRWEILSYVAGDIIELKSIDLTFSIDRVFEDIIFDSEPEI